VRDAFPDSMLHDSRRGDGVERMRKAGLSMRRMAALGAPALGLALALATPAPARIAPVDTARALTEAAAALAPNRFFWSDISAPGAISVLISIPDQRAYVFRGETLVAASTVSTGMDGKDTPVGRFTILQKDADHRSNLYDDAPMPFMQRLTWDGVALHAGRNPGFPASHGCVRLPEGFARKLFAATELGATVEVTDQAYVTPDRLDRTLASR
jgi:lipoprotein-anchoring transpeptidase ErfK/SrfK